MLFSFFRQNLESELDVFVAFELRAVTLCFGVVACRKILFKRLLFVVTTYVFSFLARFVDFAISIPDFYLVFGSHF